jgi:hypothetical protein
MAATIAVVDTALMARIVLTQGHFVWQGSRSRRRGNE